MESTPRWGITLPLRSLPLPGQRDLVAALPDLGYTDAWSSEVNGADAFAPLAVAAQWTTGLRFGTAIAGIYTRGPALLAMDANLRSPLKAEGLLTRDSRMKERKKYGQPGARKRFQYSKR